MTRARCRRCGSSRLGRDWLWDSYRCLEHGCGICTPVEFARTDPLLDLLEDHGLWASTGDEYAWGKK